jgi:hypothetical protein
MDAFRNDSEAPKREAGHPDTSRVEGSERLSVWRRRARHAARHLLVLGIRARRDRRVLATVALLVVGAGVTGGRWWQTCGFAGCPTPEALREWRPRAGDRLLTHDGQLLGLLDPVRRVPVSYERIPVHVRDAFVAVEDRRFREHGGIDVRGIVRAAVSNLRAGGVREGASTITMQLARNAFLTDEVRGWKRKALEVRYAWLLESALDKDEILERYLNTIYFGNGTWGVEAASRDLLGKGIAKATVADAALLAGLPKAPSTYNPRRNAERARARRDVVLGVLVDARIMDSSAAARVRARPVRVPRARGAPTGQRIPGRSMWSVARSIRCSRQACSRTRFACRIWSCTPRSMRARSGRPNACSRVVRLAWMGRVMMPARTPHRGHWWPSIPAPAPCAPWWAVAPSTRAGSIVRCRQVGRWGPPSSRSCMPPPSRTAMRAIACSATSRFPFAPVARCGPPPTSAIGTTA